MLKQRHDENGAFALGQYGLAQQAHTFQDRIVHDNTPKDAAFQCSVKQRGHPEPEPEPEDDDSIADLRFRRILGARGWAALPAMVRKRFSKRLHNGAAALYAGHLTEARFGFLGRCLANIMRIIGAPLPLHDHIGAVATVSVVEDLAKGGQIWSRSYHHADGFPQVIHSVKEFAGPTGIREYIGHGLGMALRVAPIDAGLAFRSDHYFLKVMGHYIALPKWFAPMHLEVRHVDKGNDPWGRSRFDFSLKLDAPLVGELLYQRVRFYDR